MSLNKIVRALALIALFAVAAVVEALHCSSLSSRANADCWWHLSTGLWILHNHTLPHTGIFSQTPEQPWIAASWLYDLKLAIWYKLVGLASIPVFSMFFKAALGVVTFLLAGGRRGNFWAAVAISAIAQYVLAGASPTPVYCSILFLGAELLLLVESRRISNMRLLFWLPLLFLVWANADVHFVCGLALLVVFLAALAIEKSSVQLDVARVAAASVLASLITPYVYRPYGVFFSTAFSAANAYLPDYKAPGFRQSEDYVLLLFVMSAFLALGLRRSRDLFLIALLAVSAAIAFHSQRDIWLVVLAASAVLGEMIGAGEPVTAADSRNREVAMGAAGAVVVVILAASILIPRRPEALLAKAGESYPVAACNYIREHRLAQPLFNTFEWGGFLAWYLPEYPVAIDSRVELYGDEFIIQYSKAMNAEVRYTDFPAMANARTIVLPRTAIMAEALRTVPGYKVAYSDNVAMVLTKEAEH